MMPGWLIALLSGCIGVLAGATIGYVTRIYDEERERREREKWSRR